MDINKKHDSHQRSDNMNQNFNRQNKSHNDQEEEELIGFQENKES
jgi:hypothetical protein